MTTYGTMQSRIANECVASGLESEIRDEIQSAIQFYESYRFAFNQGSLSFTTTTGTTAYGSATNSEIPNIQRIHRVTVGGTNWDQDIEPATYEEIFDLLNQYGDTIPTHYSYYNGELVLAPPNQAGYTVRVAYVKKLSDLVNDADTNAWMTEAELLIRTAAKRGLFIDVLQQYEDAASLTGIEARALANLQSKIGQLSYNAPAKLGEVARVASRGGPFDIRSGR